MAQAKLHEVYGAMSKGNQTPKIWVAFKCPHCGTRQEAFVRMFKQPTTKVICPNPDCERVVKL